MSEVTQSCPTLGDPMDCSLSGSSVHGILQERILEWVAISFSRGSSRPRDGTWASCIAGRFFSVCFTIITPLILEVNLHLCPSHKFSTSTEGNSAEDDMHKRRGYLQDETEVILYHIASLEVFQRNICIALLRIDHF